MSRKCQQKHWSEPLLSRHHFSYLPATSEEDDIDFVQQRVISGEDYSMDCCLCQEHYNKKKSTKYLINDDIKAVI